MVLRSSGSAPSRKERKSKAVAVTLLFIFAWAEQKMELEGKYYHGCCGHDNGAFTASQKTVR